MGTTLYMAVDGDMGDVEINNDRVFLCHLVADHRAMTELAKKLGTVPLSKFTSYAPEDFGEYIDDPTERAEVVAKAPPTEWFDPSLAIPAVRALEGHFATARFIRERGNRQDGKLHAVDRTDDLLNELKDLEMVLSRAAEVGARFRFFVGQ